MGIILVLANARSVFLIIVEHVEMIIQGYVLSATQVFIVLKAIVFFVTQIAMNVKNKQLSVHPANQVII